MIVTSERHHAEIIVTSEGHQAEMIVTAEGQEADDRDIIRILGR